MEQNSSDPGDVQSVAVTAGDVVAAVETNRTSAREAVLRVTPPFSGRMRARLHVVLENDSDETLHLDPEALLSPRVPSYPRPAETEDQLRANPDVDYTVERHHERHEAAIAEWREAVGESIADTTTLQTPAGPHEVDVIVLG